MWYDHLFDWVPDARVWEWVRTLLAALIGSVLGGFFTLRGQKRAEKAQAVRDTVARAEALQDGRRAATLADTRALFDSFVKLQREIQEAPRSIMNYARLSDWNDTWKDIWSPSLRQALRVQAELVPHDGIRNSVHWTIRYLHSARDYSWEGAPYPGKPNYPLPELVDMLAGEAVELLGAYLRDTPFTSRRSELWTNLAKAHAAYLAWEAVEVEHQEKAADASKQEQATDADEASDATKPPSGGDDAFSSEEK